jgi:hypothetical protein
VENLALPAGFVRRVGLSRPAGERTQGGSLESPPHSYLSAVGAELTVRIEFLEGRYDQAGCRDRLLGLVRTVFRLYTFK